MTGIHAVGAPPAPGRHDPSGPQSRAQPAGEPAAGLPAGKKRRAGFYIDGFNLYHALDEIRDPATAEKSHHLKWLDLWKLCSVLIDHSTEALSRVVWCSAENTLDRDKLKRHQDYQEALRSTGVEIVLGHFIDGPFKCPKCGPITKLSEKAGDVNVAIHAVADAISGGVESVYLVTSDTDQAGTAQFLRLICPEVSLVIVAPPRQTHSQHLLRYSTGKRTIEEAALLECLFPKTVLYRGKAVVERPKRYDPPAGWNKATAAAAAKGKPLVVEHKKKKKLVIPGK